MNTRVQFRVLYRQFLFRLMDVEMLSTSARGDASGLLGQFGALLVFGSVLLAWAGGAVGSEVRHMTTPAGVWGAERFMVSLTMLTVGVFALLNWESTFLERRDILVLGPLPVRGRTLLAAKIAAAAAALGITVIALNCFAGFIWPMAMSPDGVGIAGTAWFVAVFWVALFAGGLFSYCLVLSVQAAASQLPRRWYLRISPVLQVGGFAFFLLMICFQPSFRTPEELLSPQSQRLLAWLPPYWFQGLLSELSGIFREQSHAAMAPLAAHAIVNLSIAIALASGGFLLNYMRSLRKIVEEPDIAPSARGALWLPRLGRRPQTALTHFVIRTLLRSRRQRTIVAFYLGGGLALVAVYLGGARAALHTDWAGIAQRVPFPLAVASVLMLAATWLGTRSVFSLPVDLRANWVFRIVPLTYDSRERVAAVRRALVVLAVLPVAVASAGLLLILWPWRMALEHTLVLVLLGSVLADASLRGFHKIPFACSWLPGRSKVHMVFWFGVLPVVYAIHRLAQLEQRAMPAAVAVLAIVAGAARIVTDTAASRLEPEVKFEEVAADELVGLGIGS